MDHDQLAELLFPHISKDPAEYESVYPARALPAGAKVTRLGPSPTGFIHLGNLYGAFVDERLAHQSGGIFYLRIEDTDEKRLVEGAVEAIISSLAFFGVDFDEGASMDGEKGDYGPYYQSQRAEIYQTYVKQMVRHGQAYPCFCTEEELNAIREEQERLKENPGYYGKWAKHRDLPLDEVRSRLDQGQPFVVRLRSRGIQGDPESRKNENGDNGIRTISVEDGIRGTLVMPENAVDVVLLKANGIPTYHFAHVVDDHLMRTTHVVRGAEWLPSLPIHVELFQTLNWPLPVYCHTAQLMKMEDGNKRKLSKRKDPELSLDYYRSEGYHPKAVREYLLTILNSNYEEWRLANPDAPQDSFEFTVEKMSNSGALFDLDKLNDISKDVLVKIPAAELCEFLIGWAKAYRPELVGLFEGHEDYLMRILDLGRQGEKPRKDFVFARQMFEFISYFYDDYFKAEDPYPENVSAADVKTILSAYLESYNHGDDQTQWFDKIRGIAEANGYAARPKDYKKNPELYKGHVGDVSTVIRIALMGRAMSPDIWEIQQILGEERTKERIKKVL
jgi:glutamyl-tRNA synthetase